MQHLKQCSWICFFQIIDFVIVFLRETQRAEFWGYVNIFGQMLFFTRHVVLGLWVMYIHRRADLYPHSDYPTSGPA